MSSPLLTAEELAALRSSEGRDGGRVVPVDLLGGERNARKALTTLERELGPVVGTAQALLGRVLRVPCIVDSKGLEVVGIQAATVVLEAQILSARLRGTTETLAYVSVDPSLAFALVEAAFGASFSDVGATVAAVAVPDRGQLTAVEQRIVGPALLEIAGAMVRAVYGDAGGAHVELCPKGVELSQRCDYVVLWRLDVNAGGASGTVLAAMLPAMLTAVRGESGSASLANPDPRHMGTLLRAAPVEVTVDLGGVEMAIGELLALRPEDVLRLDRGQADLLPVAVQGVPKLWGRPIQRNGVFGIEVVKEVG